MKALKARAAAAGRAACDKDPFADPWKAAWTPSCADARRGAVEADVRRASGAERRRGSSIGSKALKGKPHGRYRDETSLEGVRRSKAVRRVRNPGGGS
jgi:hypothetical protein